MKRLIVLLIVLVASVIGVSAQAGTNNDSVQAENSRFGLGLAYTFPNNPKLLVCTGFWTDWRAELRLGYKMVPEGHDAMGEYRALYSDIELNYFYWQRERIRLFAGIGANWEHIFVSDGHERSDPYFTATLLGMEWRPIKEIPYLAFGVDGIYQQGPDGDPKNCFRIKFLCYP